MTDPDPPVLVRVSQEMLVLLKDGSPSPVVILGVREHDDGTYEMVLQSPDRDEMVEREAIEELVAQVRAFFTGGDYSGLFGAYKRVNVALGESR